MANNKRIVIGLDFETNLTEINKLKEQIKKIQLDASFAKDAGNLTNELKGASKAASDLEDALNGSWNSKLGQLDLSKLNKSIKESYGSLKNFKDTLEKGGSSGVNLFNNFSKAVLGTNTQIKQTNKLLNDMATSMSNTVKWGVTSAIFNNIANSIQKSWDYSLKLDSSLNDIRIVTGKSADEMERFAKTANNAAKNLGASTLDYTEAALIYYQQGLNEQDVQARANTTLKVANVTGQSGQSVSEQLTAVWNGYKVSAQEAETYIDKLSAVAATTAADLEELSTGMSKVASAANVMGVDVDQLNAQLATIISVTRQAPESVGTALKTIYARMSDIEAGIEESGVTLGSYTEKMAEMGINVLNANGELRDMGEVIEEIGGKWEGFSREQQIALTQVMAGTRQYNNLIALFDSWGMYEEALNDSRNSAGELQKQQDIYMESTEAHLQQLATEAEKTYDILFDENAVKTMTDGLTRMLSIVNTLFSSLGGGLGSFSFIGMSAANIFSSQIGGAVAQHQYNKEVTKQQKNNIQGKKPFIEVLREDPSKVDLHEVVERSQDLLDNAKSMTDEEQRRAQEQINRLRRLAEERKLYEEIFEISKRRSEIGEVEDFSQRSQIISANKILAEEKKAATGWKKALSIDNLDSSFNKFIGEYYSSSISSYLHNKSNLEDLLKSGPSEGVTKEEYDEEIKLLREITAEAKKEADKELPKFKELFKEVRKSMVKEFGEGSEEVQRILDQLEKNIFNLDVISEKDLGLGFINDSIDEAEKQIKAEEVSITQDQKKLRENFNQIEKNGKKTGETLKQSLDGVNEKAKAVTENLRVDFQKVFTEEAIATQIRGYTTLMNTFMALGNAVRIFSDETLTAEEQWSQFGTLAVATGIQILMNWSSIKETFVLLGGQITALTKKYLLLALGEEFAAKVADVGFKKALAGIFKTKMALIEVLWPILAITAAIGAIVVIVNAVVKEMNKEKDAALAATEQVGRLTNAYNELNKKAEEFRNLTSDYEKGVESLKEMNKEAEDYGKTLDEVNAKAEELIKTYGLYDDYHYENGLIVFNETQKEDGTKSNALKDIQYELDLKASAAERNMYGAQIFANEKNLEYETKKTSDKIHNRSITHYTVMGDPYYTETFNFSKEEAQDFANLLKQQKEEDAIKYDAIIKNTDGAMEKFIKETYKGNVEMALFTDQIVDCADKFDFLVTSMEKAEEANNYYAEQLNLISIKSKYGDKINKLATDDEGNVNTARAEQIAQVLNNTEAQKRITRFKRSEREIALSTSEDFSQSGIVTSKQQNRKVQELAEEYGYLKEGEFKERFGRDLEENEDLLRIYAEQIQGYSATEVANLVYKDGNLVNAAGDIITEGGADFHDKYRSDIYNLITSEFIDKVFDKTAEGETEKYTQQLETLMQSTQDFGEAYGVDFTDSFLNALATEDKKLDFSSLFGEISPEERDELLKLADDPEELKKRFNLTDEMLTAMGLGTAKDFAKNFKQGLDKYDVSGFLVTLKKRIKEVTSIIGDLEQGKELTDEQITLLEGLEAENEKLAQIRDRNSQRYLDTLQEVNDKLEEERISLEQFEASELIGEGIKITGDTDELTDKLEEISEANYEVVVAIKADAQSDFDNVVNKMTLIEEMASKIGDDFVVSANDIEELNNTFPGIVTGMELLADGSAKLNKQSVQDAIKTAQANAQLKTQELVDSLQKQQLEVLAKRDAAQKIADIAKKQAEGAELNADVESDINENLNILKQDNAEITTDYEKQTQKDVVDSSKENSDKMASNFSGAYKKMAADSKAWADAAKQNLLVAQTGEGETTAGSFSGDYHATESGTIITTAQKGDLKNSEDLPKTSEEWLEVQKFYEDLAKTYDETANNFQGKIAEALAKNNEFNKTLSNIGKGLGSDGEKDGGKDELDHIDRLESELDLYHDINIELGRIDKQLSQLKDQQDKLLGQDLINNLNEQFILLQKQIEKTKDKINDMTDEANALKDDLGKKNVEFNEDGTIKNYTQAYNDALNYVNGLVDQYNAMTDKASQEAFKETVETAKKEFEQFEEDLKRYAEIIEEEIPDLNEDIQDAFNEQIEIRIKKFNTEIEIRLEMSQAERDWNEFKKNVIDKIADDNILGNAKARLQDFHSYYKEGETEGAIEETTRHINDILFELGEMDRGIMSNFYGDNKAAAFEDLKKYYGQLMEDLTAVEELSKEVRQSYLDMMDKAQEDFDKQISKYEQITDLIDHDMKLIELLHGDKSYEAFGKYYEKQEENYNQQLDFQKRQVDFWAAEMEAAKNDAERWAIAEENWSSAVTEWKSLINTAIENIQDKYLNTIKSIFEELNNKVTGDLGLEYVNEQWGLINRNAEEYLDAINAMYGIEDLQNKYLDAIDKTDSLSAQRKLNELMEQEVKALEEKDKLTQYDVDRAMKKYDIALKQIALEEAQQNKTSMRLKRDSQGNYSYQFTADEDAVKAAEDELAAAQNELYNFDKENYINNLDEIYAAWEEYQEKMFEAAQINDPDERLAREKLLNEQYGELINNLTGQNLTIRNNLYESAFEEHSRLYDRELEEYLNMTQAQKDELLTGLIPQWDSGVQHMADVFADEETGFTTICEEAMKKLSAATEEYNGDLEEVEKSAEITFETVVEGTDEAIDGVEDLLEENDELIESYEDELEAIQDVIDELDTLIEKFNDARDAAIEAAQAAYEYQQAERGDFDADDFSDTTDFSKVMTDRVQSLASVKDYDVNEDDYLKQLADERQQKIDRDNTVTSVDNERFFKVLEAYVDPENEKHKDAVELVGLVDKGQLHYTKETLDKYKFNTGGYTGTWAGEAGRLALLHQKELVLNAEDTKNILNAVQVLRTIDGSVLQRLASMNGTIGAPKSNLDTAEAIEQNVHIDAQFPNVTNSHEIENAFNNLINIASQRAFRKK